MEKRKIIWLDNSVDEQVPGKLLSDNLGFYGECVLTGVEYSYLSKLTGIGDTKEDMPEFSGRRLLDGWLSLTYKKKPAEAKNELIVEFDFKQECTFSEVDFFCTTEIQNREVSVSKDGKAFYLVELNAKNSKSSLYRNPFKDKAEGRYLRLCLKAEEIRLFQVWVWGDVEEKESARDLGVEDFKFCNSISMQSLMGVPQTAFTDLEGFRWTKKLKAEGFDKFDCVFSPMAPYESLSSSPILPEVDKLNGCVETRICQNGTGVACVALTNTSMSREQNVEIVLDNSTPLRAELFVAGTMPSRWYGNGVVALFNEKFDIAKPLKYKYVLNASVIADFPHIHLPAGGTCIFWVRIYADLNEAGDYSMTLKAGNSSFDIKARVLPIKLEKSNVGVMGWGSRTNMIPFTYEDRIDNELKSRKEIGINIYRGWPERNEEYTNAGYIRDMNSVALKKDKDAQFIVNGLNKELRAWLHSSVGAEKEFTEEVVEKVKAAVEENIEHAKKLGLDYDQWLIDFPDEPHERNIKGMGEAVKIIKKFYPQVRIYMNPSFWVGYRNGAVSSDEVQCECLKDWYNLIDMSVPLSLNFEERPNAMEYYTKKRQYNGQYTVIGQHISGDRTDLLRLPRANVWDSLARDMNLWGFYAYSALRFDCWNNVLCPHIDKDCGMVNYQAVYPGKDAPVPTRAYEQMREGYEDYMIMEKLKEKDLPLYKQLQQEYLSGNTDFEKLRSIAIDSLLEVIE